MEDTASFWGRKFGGGSEFIARLIYFQDELKLKTKIKNPHQQLFHLGIHLHTFLTTENFQLITHTNTHLGLS